ncbi:MAG: hypothetical protein LBB38_00585 [Puniceicoccales bacterium]|jgi:hypothetical protein|nr:hypothetical protein [Puniceicoccales bacterium]
MSSKLTDQPTAAKPAPAPQTPAPAPANAAIPAPSKEAPAGDPAVTATVVLALGFCVLALARQKALENIAARLVESHAYLTVACAMKIAADGGFGNEIKQLFTAEPSTMQKIAAYLLTVITFGIAYLVTTLYAVKQYIDKESQFGRDFTTATGKLNKDNVALKAAIVSAGEYFLKVFKPGEGIADPADPSKKITDLDKMLLASVPNTKIADAVTALTAIGDADLKDENAKAKAAEIVAALKPILGGIDLKPVDNPTANDVKLLAYYLICAFHGAIVEKLAAGVELAVQRAKATLGYAAAFKSSDGALSKVVDDLKKTESQLPRDISAALSREGNALAEAFNDTDSNSSSLDATKVVSVAADAFKAALENEGELDHLQKQLSAIKVSTDSKQSDVVAAFTNAGFTIFVAKSENSTITENQVTSVTAVIAAINRAMDSFRASITGALANDTAYANAVTADESASPSKAKEARTAAEAKVTEAKAAAKAAIDPILLKIAALLGAKKDAGTQPPATAASATGDKPAPAKTAAAAPADGVASKDGTQTKKKCYLNELSTGAPLRGAPVFFICLFCPPKIYNTAANGK